MGRDVDRTSCPGTDPVRLHEGDRLVVEKRADVGKSEDAAVIWQKACACTAVSVAGDVRIEAQPGPASVVFVATYSPAPTCRKCGTEWRRVRG